MTKRRKGRGSCYEQPDRAGFIISWIDFDGQRKRRTVKTASRPEAMKALQAEKDKVEKAKAFGVPLPSEDSFEKWAQTFLKEQKKKVSAVEYERQRGIVEGRFIKLFKDRKLASIRKGDIVRFVNSRRGEASPGTIIKETNILKRLLEAAVEEEMIPFNPARKAKLPKAPDAKPFWLRDHQFDAVLDACEMKGTEKHPKPKAQWLRQAVLLTRGTGVRRGELLKVRVPDFDLEGDKPSLDLPAANTKAGRDHTVYLNNKWTKMAVEEMDIAERQKSGDKGVLWPEIDNPAQLTMGFIHAVERARKAGCEIPKGVSFHTIRHTVGTTMFQKGVQLEDISRQLNHGDLRMTRKYAKSDAEHSAKIAAFID